MSTADHRSPSMSPRRQPVRYAKRATSYRYVGNAFTTTPNSAGSKNSFRTLPFSLRRRMFGLAVTRGGLLLIASV